MSKLISKIKYQYEDLLFNSKIFNAKYLWKYYWYSYFLKEKFVDVQIKEDKQSSIFFKIRCRNRFDRNGLYNVFVEEFHLTESNYLKKDKPIILDIGANIGLTIVDYKLLFPNSIVYGYEMDKDNFDLAETNCRGFSNVFLFNKAVWTRKDILTYSRNTGSDAYSIHNESNCKNVKVQSLSISDILFDNHIQNVDFLKMDIEGAEIDIFDDPNLEWLNFIFSLNVEFHNISNGQLSKYVDLLINNGFQARRSSHHWLAIEAVKPYSD